MKHSTSKAEYLPVMCSECTNTANVVMHQVRPTGFTYGVQLPPDWEIVQPKDNLVGILEFRCPAHARQHEHD